jgi:hypothetical protein
MTTLNQLFEQEKFAEAVALCENEMKSNPSTDTQFNLALSYYHLAFQQEENERKSTLELSQSKFENLISIYENEAVSTAQKHHNLFDKTIRMVCLAIVCLFGSLAFIFWLIGLEHNLVWNLKSLSYWGLGLSIILISLGIGFLALYPTKVEGFFSYSFTKILIRIPVYSIAFVGVFIFFRQIFHLKQ